MHRGGTVRSPQGVLDVQVLGFTLQTTGSESFTLVGERY